MKIKQVTSTSVVFEYLCKLDDFAQARQVQQATGLDSNHVSAALYHLRKFKAADCIVVENGSKALWWFATPATDTRTFTVDERAPEAGKRSARGMGKRISRACMCCGENVIIPAHAEGTQCGKCGHINLRPKQRSR